MPERKFTSFLDLALNLGSDDVYLVLDTSFLVDLSVGHLWAINSYFYALAFANNAGKPLHKVVPEGVARQYNSFMENGVKDEITGRPFAGATIDELLKNNHFIIRQSSSLAAGGVIWGNDPKEDTLMGKLSYVQLKTSSVAKEYEDGPGDVDLEVLSTVTELAPHGTVLVGSYDLKDMNRRIDAWQAVFEREDWNIVPLGPRELDKGNFDIWQHVSFTITKQAFSELMNAKFRDNIEMPWLILENGVRSGNVPLNVGFGIAYKQAFKKLELPEHLQNLGENYSAIPVIYHNGLKKPVSWVIQRLRETKSKSVIMVMQDTDWLPVVFSSASSNPYILSFGFLSDPAYLAHHTTSEFGKRAYEMELRKRTS